MSSALLVLSCSGSKPAPNSALSVKDLVAKNAPSVVRIEIDRFDGGTASGTGFIIARDGRIATNLHVVVGAKAAFAAFPSGKRVPLSTVVAFDDRHDLAIMSPDKAPADMPMPLKLGNSDLVNVGESVVAIGNPLGIFQNTVSDGLISSVRPLTQDLTVIQISAPISQGSSGGPLFNSQGEVIGIATFITVDGQNLNFGVPSNYLHKLIAQGRQKEQTVTQFLEHSIKENRELAKSAQGPKVKRQIPRLPPAILDGCEENQVREVLAAISQAIELGAPVYNQGEHEACFVIYRKVAEKYATDKSTCTGIRDTFGKGLLRVETTDTYTEKAWVMRDTFDGLLPALAAKAGPESRP